jgi:hypothetical protein
MQSVGKMMWCSLKRYRFITDKYDQFKNIYIHGHFSGFDKQNIFRIVSDRELCIYQTTNSTRIWVKNSIRENKIDKTLADFLCVMF